MMRRLVQMVGAALLFAGAAIAVIARLGRDWEARVAVSGHSMEPTLFDGDWLLVDPAAFDARAPRDGQLVVALDPRGPDRQLVKRVQWHDGQAYLTSDNAKHVGDRIGPVTSAHLLGRPWFRYWPMERLGPVR